MAAVVKAIVALLLYLRLRWDTLTGRRVRATP